MTSIDRTAYPKFSKRTQFRKSELLECYSLSNAELAFVKKHARTQRSRLNLSAQLKIIQNMGKFFETDEIPGVIIKTLRAELGISSPLKSSYSHRSKKSTHRNLIRQYLNIVKWELRTQKEPQQTPPIKLAITFAYKTAQTMNNPADIINAVIEKFVQENYELPPYSTLDRLVRHVRNLVNTQIFKNLTFKLKQRGVTKIFDKLLDVPKNYNRSNYNALKQSPKRPTINNFKDLISHHNWLMNMGDINFLMVDVAKIKVEQFAEQAKSLDVSDLREMPEHTKYGLMASLLSQSQQRIKDALANIFCKTIHKMHKLADAELETLRNQNVNMVHDLAKFLYQLSNEVEDHQNNPGILGAKFLNAFKKQGGHESIAKQCEKVMAQNSKNYLPLLYGYYRPKRPTLFNLLKSIKLMPSSQDTSLQKAIDFMINNSHRRTETIYISEEVDLSFTTEAWRKLIFDTDNKNQINRRYFEMCIFTHIFYELRSGDLFVIGADSFGDYRSNLLPWKKCQPFLKDFCENVGIPNNQYDFVQTLRQKLNEKAKQVDKLYPKLSELIIDENGVPALKRRIKKNPKGGVLLDEVKNRMPERNLIDILCDTHQYTGWAKLFGPLSGSEPKLQNAIERYIINAFGMGTGMGPMQTARHVKAKVSAHTLSRINRRHVNLKMLDAAIIKLINFSNQLPITKILGDAKRCATDGTLRNIFDNNIIAETHYRYKSKGGIAYHHISDNYIALFSTFITCGVWEAIAIIDGLLKNKSDIQPDTVHADTQGQSTPVFGLAYLFGIKLMPRIRNWQDLTFFRPDKSETYQHIDNLFGVPIDWDLISTHWQDLMQVVISIYQGKVSSSTLLRKLNNYSHKNRLYKAFQELGRVIRTFYLLDYISNPKLRENITISTNKVEAYNGLSDWTTFGSNFIVNSNDADEMEKAIKYNTVITNSIILQNFIDISSIIIDLKREGWDIMKEDIVKLSPYLTEHIKRFGDYIVNLKRIPPIPCYIMDAGLF